MPILTAEEYMVWVGAEFTGKELASIQDICVKTEQAIKNKLRRVVERGTFSVILDAPMTQYIDLCRWAPIDTAEDFNLYLNYQANGNPDAFTDDSLLTEYTDYVIQGKNEGTNTDAEFGACRVMLLNGFWGLNYYLPPYSIAPQRQSMAGAIKVEFTGGFDPVPEALKQGACIIVSQVLGIREYGMLKGTESWNGYNYNIPGVGLLIGGFLAVPDVRSMLDPYTNYAAVIA